MISNYKKQEVCPPKDERNQAIYEMRMRGETFKNISIKFNVSMARVRQIIDTMDKRVGRIKPGTTKPTEFRQFSDVSFKG